MQKFYERSAYICLGLSIALILAMVFSSPAKAEDAQCTSARILTAYSWAALDDAEESRLSAEVLQALEMELAVSVEVATALCGE